MSLGNIISRHVRPAFQRQDLTRLGVSFAPPVKSKPKRLKLSRRTIWLRKHRIPTFHIAQIKTLAEVRWEAVKQAMARNQGNVLATARELVVNPKTVRAILKQNRRKKPLLQIVGLCLAMCLCGCVTKHVAGYTPIHPQPLATPPLPTDVQRASTLSFITAMAAPLPNTNAPVGQSIPLSWDMDPRAAFEVFRVYASSNKLDWRLVAETANKFAAITNIFLPQWFLARSVAGENESLNSNILGWLGNDQIILVTAEASGDLTTWSEYATIFKGTNVPGMKFFRTRASTTTKRVIE